METVDEKNEQYRQIIQRLLTRLAAIPNLEEGIEDRLLFDENNDSYAIIAEGWDGEERIHNIVAHLEIINGKVWIQADNTDLVIARELGSEGIPKSDIVLGFRPPSARSQSEYAMA
ncbi:MAG TPA: XisI protein [Blastocatellia bacterium]|jgi:hypothetical protein